MRIPAIALLAVPLSLVAQTTHPIQSGGSTSSDPAPYYSPQHLTIQLGDRVRWTNATGTHNVNGTQELFPANPASFYSGIPDNGMWSYLYTFDIPGVYNYRCESEGHAETQYGTITVEGTVGSKEHATAYRIIAFPTPAEDVLFVDIGDLIVERIDVIGLDGRTLLQLLSGKGDLLRIPLQDLGAGTYLLRTLEYDGSIQTLRFVKR